MYLIILHFRVKQVHILAKLMAQYYYSNYIFDWGYLDGTILSVP